MLKKHLLRVPMILMILLAAVSGCTKGKAVAKVTGKVILDGQAIPMGTVTMVSEDRQLSGSGMIAKDGTYTVEEAPIGKVKVSVVPPPAPPALPPTPKGVKLPPEAAKVTALPDEFGDPKVFQTLQRMPQEYKDAERSGLTYIIHDGDNTYDIVLNSKKATPR